MDCIEQHRAFNRKFSNFYVEPNTDATSSLIYRERNGTKHQIEIGRRLDQSSDSISNVYSYENMETKNMYELLVRTSLATRIFSSYPHQYIAVTKELLELPYEQQPWFRGIITEKGRRAVGTGKELIQNIANNFSFMTRVIRETFMCWMEIASKRCLNDVTWVVG